MLTRLEDRIETDPSGKTIKIHRYGLWGITAEIEKRNRKWVVVHKNKQEKEFPSLAESEIYLNELRAKGRSNP